LDWSTEVELADFAAIRSKTRRSRRTARADNRIVATVTRGILPHWGSTPQWQGPALRHLRLRQTATFYTARAVDKGSTATCIDGPSV
jgi:hypothetical protein